MASTSIHGRTLDTSVIDEAAITNKPWASDLLEKTLKASRKGVLAWCNTIVKIGEPEIDLDDYLRIFSEQVEGLFEDLVVDIDSIHQKVLDKIEESLEQLQKLCRDLDVDMPQFTKFKEMPLHELKKSIASHVHELEKQARSRRCELAEINRKLDELSKAFGKSLERPQESPLPTHEEIRKYRNLIEDLENEKMDRETKYYELKEQIFEIVKELQKEPSLDFETDLLNMTDSEVMITDYHMDQLVSYHGRLERELKSVKAEIGDLRAKIDDIWDKLELDFKERDAFRQKYTGNSLRTLEALKSELRRCERLKQANIKTFIDNQRKDLLEMWEKCHCTEATRNEFSFFNSDCYNEDLLDLHERETEKWRQFYIENGEIFGTLQEHHKLWQEKLKLDLDSVASGVNRYKNRGGKLLDEEKARNKLEKRIPKLEEKLLRLAGNFSERNGREFLTFGRTIEEYLESLHEQRDADLKYKLSAKKLQREQSTLTAGRSGLRTNLFGQSKLAPTPNGKRKCVATPATEQAKKVKTAMLQKKSASCALPKVNVSRTRRMSKIREKRRSKLSSASTSRTMSNKENETTSTNYNQFEREMTLRNGWRSTGFALKENKENNVLQVPEIVVTSPKKAPPHVFATPKGRFGAQAKPTK